MTAITNDQSRFSVKAFSAGLGFVALIYAGVAGWTFVQGPHAIEMRAEKLASNTIKINRAKPLMSGKVAMKSEAYGPYQEALAEPPDTAAEAPHEDHPDQHAAPSHTEEPETPPAAPVEPVKPVTPQQDAQLSNLKKLSSGMYSAPVDGLYEDAKEGRLPVKRSDGLTPFKAYKKPFAAATNSKPVISIAIMDMGLSAKATESAIQSLPGEVTLIVSPYAASPDMWVNEARTDGHEVWLSLPMESSSYPKSDPGPHTLLVGSAERENIQKLEWTMSRAVGYAGLVASYKPEFMASSNDARPILGEIYKRGIGFIDSSNMPGAIAESSALSMNAPYSNVDVWIDRPEDTKEIIRASLQQLEIIATEHGFAAGIIHPSAISYREIQSWIGTLDDKGFVLAPLSAQTGY